jgi:uncharacterized protein with HEPN domain
VSFTQRDLGYRWDMLESAKLYRSYVQDTSKEEFLKDSQKQDAVIRRLLVVGEAAGRVSKETKEKLKDVPWQRIIGLRNILVHDYGDINSSILWDVLKNDVPVPVSIIERDALEVSRGVDPN